MTKHQPIRTCIGCGKKDYQSNLRRIAVSEDGKVFWDPRRCQKGRGAYLCDAEDCFDRAARQKRFARAFRRAVDIEVLIEGR